MGDRLPGSQRRAALVDAALGLLTDRAPSSLRSDDIAHVLGVSRTLLYAHFDSVDEVIAAAYLSFFSGLVELLGRHAVLDQDDYLRAVIGDYLAFARDHEGQYRNLLHADVLAHPAVRGARQAHARRIGATIAEGLAGELAATVMLAGIESAALVWLDAGAHDLDQTAALLWTQLWHGLGSIAPATRPQVAQPEAELRIS